MAPEKTVAELDRVVQQTCASCIALSTIGDEIRAVLTEDRHDPDLTATVVAAHAKRAALAITTIAGLAGELAVLARVGAGLVLFCMALAGCAAAVAPPSPGEAFASCGFDKAECGEGLECFGVCTFECGEKYATDGSYGLDQASVDRCAALGGSCERYAPGVAISVCKLPGSAVEQ